MKLLSQTDYDALRADAQILEEDDSGEKVLALADGATYLKLFRRKQLLSSALWSPYAARFEDNARRLHMLDVPTVEVVAAFRVPSIQRTAIQYVPVAGKTLRDVAESNGGYSRETIEELGRFVASLHEKGVFFHSLHLGNVLMMESGSFGLIDIADMKIQRRALSLDQRIRNLGHLLRYAKDLECLRSHGEHRFSEAYLDAARINEVQRAKLRSAIATMQTDFIEHRRRTKR